MIVIKNQKTNEGLFTAFIPLKISKKTKSIVFKKKVEGSDKQKNYIKGEASNTLVDKANERVSKKFIQKMVDQLKEVNVFIEHEQHLLKTVGYVSDTFTEGDSLIVETALEDEEDNELVKTILKKAAHGTKIFYSIAGRITSIAKTADETTKKTIKELLDGEIYEVSLVALPEGNVGFLEPIVKSMKRFYKKYNEHVEESIEAQITKALTEMMESSKLNDDLWNLFSSYREAVWKVTNNSDLTPAEKKSKLLTLAGEYSGEVENISTKMAELIATIESELN